MVYEGVMKPLWSRWHHDHVMKKVVTWTCCHGKSWSMAGGDRNKPSWEFQLKGGLTEIIHHDCRKVLEDVLTQWVYLKGLLQIPISKRVWNVPSLSHDWKCAGTREDTFSMLRLLFLYTMTGMKVGLQIIEH